MKEKLIDALLNKLNTLEKQPSPDLEEVETVKTALKVLGVDVNKPHPNQESLTL